MPASADTPVTTRSAKPAKPAPSDAARRKRRRKIPLACEPCRERKSRCDGGKPICSGCQRRSLQLEDCVYSLDNARSASNDEYIKTLHDRIRQLEKLCSAGELAGLSSGPPNEAPTAPEGLHSGESSLDPPPVSLPPPQPTTIPAASKTSPAASSSPHHAADVNVFRLPPVPVPPANGISPSHHSGEIISRNSPRFEREPHGVSGMGIISSEDGVADDPPTARTNPRDYYGGSSAASFIREAFGTIHRNTTPHAPPASAPTYVNVSEQAGGVRTPSSRISHIANFALPPRRLADHLLNVYFQRVYYLYPFFHRPAFMKAYHALWDPSSTSADDSVDYPGVGLGGSPDEGPDSIIFHCALNGIFALACYCCSDLSPSERLSGAETFFDRVKGHVGLALLEHNNMGAIQALLITALFLQGTPYPSRCWNSVGIACRLAQGLGLHAETSGKLTLEREMRLRTWYGCVVLDMLVSMTFGRPTMTTFAPSLPLPSTADDGGSVAPTRLQFYVESIRLSKVLEQILVRVYQPWKSKAGGSDQRHFSLDTVIELDAQLSRFEAAVPWPLRWRVVVGMAPPEDMAACLVMQRHVLHSRYVFSLVTLNCLSMYNLDRIADDSRFLYMRLMLFRPVLSQLAADRDRSKAPEMAPSLSSSCNRSLLSSSFAVECGKSCAQAAVDLISLTHATYLAPESGAWWWSGLCK